MTPRDELAVILRERREGIWDRLGAGDWLELHGPAVLALIDALPDFQPLADALAALAVKEER